MFRMGIIEESLKNIEILNKLKPFLIRQRIEEVPTDISPIWHINEYHLSNDEMIDLLPLLEKQVKPTWYIHAFNQDKLIVIMQGKSFFISLHKDSTWEEMIAYGESVCIDRYYLENIPLSI